MMWEFTFYEDARGRAPAKTFLDKLTDLKQRAFVVAKLEYYATLPVLAPPHYKRFTNYPVNFGELIIGDYRIFVHRVSANTKEYTMLHAFRKQSQKTPAAEIDVAFGRVLDFISREDYEKEER